jgi:hypothetical protein
MSYHKTEVPINSRNAIIPCLSKNFLPQKEEENEKIDAKVTQILSKEIDQNEVEYSI